MPSGTTPPTLSPAERAIAAYNARVLVVSLAGAVVVLAGLLYTGRKYRLSHRGQVTGRFTKAPVVTSAHCCFHGELSKARAGQSSTQAT
jgi:hypothetical protein